jgi:signal transduction histidine kinase
MVAHDLRSPLTGLLLSADLLQVAGGSDEKLRHTTVAQIKTTTLQMMRLTNDLVDVHALKEGRRAYQWVALDACAVLHEAVSAHSEPAAWKRIRLALQTEEPIMTLESDAGAIRQIVDNLLSNALKFSPVNSAVGTARSPLPRSCSCCSFPRCSSDLSRAR